MNVKEIIEKYLRENGYDGLFNAADECGCLLDDFMPCDENWCLYCEPGFKRPGDGDTDWIVGPEREQTC